MLRYLTSGESHGKSLISILDGKLDNIIKGIEIRKNDKILKINKLVYMDDLKVFINENENTA